MRKCSTEEWIKKTDNNREIKEKCFANAVKTCRHDFATCGRHKHGCKNEEQIGVA